jgi:hypothetical protein
MNFINIFKKSILSPDGKESSTRISSYIILLLIVLFSISFLTVFIYLMITKGIPTEMIIVFGMLLAHHLALLGINKHNETKQINNSDK